MYAIRSYPQLRFVATISSVHSQNADQQVIASAGDASTSNGAELTWTIGQTVASSSSRNSIFLSEGFQQSEIITIELGPAPEAQVITIYPNPTTDFINMNASKNKGTGSFHLASIKGEILIENQQADFSEENRIDLTEFADGVYLLFIKNEDQPMRQFKIIKN